MTPHSGRNYQEFRAFAGRLLGQIRINVARPHSTRLAHLEHIHVRWEFEPTREAQAWILLEKGHGRPMGPEPAVTTWFPGVAVQNVPHWTDAGSRLAASTGSGQGAAPPTADAAGPDSVSEPEIPTHPELRRLVSPPPSEANPRELDVGANGGPWKSDLRGRDTAWSSSRP